MNAIRSHRTLKNSDNLFTKRRHREHFFLETLEDRTLLSQYGRLPMSFELNQGQTDSQVAYLARGGGYGLFLSSNETVLSLQAPSVSTTNTPGTPPATPAPPTVITTEFVGANPSPTISGVNQDQGVTNYFVGNDPSKWLTNVPSYAKVQYQNLYNGVNLVFHGNGTQLEYDYVVSPGADPSVIKMAISGADSVTLDSQGNLILHTAAGDVQENAPVVYQNTSTGQEAVSGEFVIATDGTVGFKLGAYDTSKALVIDPTLVYSKPLGTSGPGNAIAVDSSGDAYVTGSTSSIPGGGTTVAYVEKLNSTGTGVLYFTTFGGTGGDSGKSIAVDSLGNAYVTGLTSSVNFPTTSGAPVTSYGGAGDSFVTKLNPTGTALLYSTYLGGSGNDYAVGIAVDASGNAYVAGWTNSPNFQTTPGAAQTTVGSLSSFVTKLNPTGTVLIYSTYLGGSSFAEAYGIALDASGDAYITGCTIDSPFYDNFPTTPGAAFTTSFGVSFFVTELNPRGTAWLYSTYLCYAWGNFDVGAIAVDGAGDAYVTGRTFERFATTPGAAQTTFGGGYSDAFVSKLNPTGTAVLYSTFLGGSSDDIARSIAVDGTGNAYITGTTYSHNFPTTTDAIQPYDQFSPGFVTELNPTGTAWLYSSYLRDGFGGFSIALDESDNVYVSGSLATKFTLAGSVSTGTTLSGSTSTLTYGQSTTLTANVSPSSGSGLPTGSVTFSYTASGLNGTVGTTVLGTAPLILVNGVEQATFTTPPTLAVDNYSFSASYSGDSSYAPSVTTTSIGASITQASLTVTALNQTKYYGTTLVSPSTLFSSSGLVNGETIGTVVLDSPGAAADAPVSGSPYPLNASGATGGTFNPNNYAITYVSGALTISQLAATGISVWPSASSETYGQSMTLTAWVTPLLTGVPTGTVTFYEYGTNISLGVASLSLVAGHAQATVSTPTTLGAGSFLLAASYSGDSSFAPSQTGPTVTVTVAPTPLTVQVYAGASLNKTYGTTNVTGDWGGYQVLGLQNHETCYLSYSSPGFDQWASAASTSSPTYTVTLGAPYGGSFNSNNYVFQFGSIPIGSLTVVAAGSSTTVNSPSITYGQTATATINVSSPVGFPPGPLPESVSLYVDGLSVPVGNVINGTVTVSLGSIAAGDHAVTAYFGDRPGTGGSYPGDYIASQATTTLHVAKAALTVTATNQNVGHGDPMPGWGYGITGFVKGDLPSVITGTPVLSTTATDTNTIGAYPITVDATQMSAANYNIVAIPGVLTVRPKVVDVRVSYGNQSMSVLGLNRDLPFINIDAIDVIFSDDVNVDQSMLQLLSAKTPSYPTSGFHYNPATHDATWTLPAALGIDHYVLMSNGSSVNAGGVSIGQLPLATGVNVLPGDVNGDGSVTAADVIAVRNAETGPYVVWADVNSDGTVDNNDLLEVRKRVGNQFS